MLHRLAPAILILSLLSLMFAISLFNMWLAKRKVSEWKRFSSWQFLQSMLSPVGASEAKASIWMRRFGYGNADAQRLANFQTIANFEQLICMCIWILIVALLTSK
jgi:hypothetical protein